MTKGPYDFSGDGGEAMSAPERDRGAEDLAGDRGRIGMWLFICTEILLFGGLFLLYSVYRYKHQADFHAASLNLSRFDGTLNTIVLITSSLTAALAVHELREGRSGRARLFIGATLLLALTFLTVKGFEWGEKFEHGLYPDAPHLLSLPSGPDPLLRPVLHDDRAPRDPRHRRHGHLRLLPAVDISGQGRRRSIRSSSRTRPSSGTSSTSSGYSFSRSSI